MATETRDDSDSGEAPARRRRSSREVLQQMRVGAASISGIVATAVVIVTAVFALICAVHIIFAITTTNSHNWIVTHVNDWADTLAGPFKNIFDFKNKGQPRMKLNTTINYGIAAIVWLIIGRIISTILRRVFAAGRSSE